MFRKRRRSRRAATCPSPKERRRIIARREKLTKELIKVTITTPTDYLGFNRLVAKYGPEEVQIVLDSLIKPRDTFINEKAQLYREYRQTFARFGGDRRFLEREKCEALIFELAKLYSERARSLFSFLRRRSAREKTLRDLLLTDERSWPDLFPPNVPPRPPDYDAPAPRDYTYPVRNLLQWGWAIDEQRVLNNARNVSKWRPAVPELIYMVLDEGLLNGWPGEDASWGPIHALLMLGELRADEAAPQFLSLMEQKNDWLSDQLPWVWGKMGQPAERCLWAYQGDRQHDPEHQGAALLGLSAIAQEHPDRRSAVIKGLADRLDDASPDDAEVNAYIVDILEQMRAIEATGAIVRAFEAGKVDTRIITPYDLIMPYD